MEFQGFQHSYPVLFTIITALLLVALSWYSYRNNRHIPATFRYGLIGIRSLLFLFLLFLILNPYFLRTEQTDQKNTLLFMLDDSESTTLQKGDYSGSETYRSLLSELFSDPAMRDINAEIFRFSDQSFPVKDASALTLSGSETNLNQAFSQILELEDEADAVILISDGIITYGKNPLLEAVNLTIPIFSIGLGDTTEVRDIVIQSVETPSTGFTESDHPVTVSVSQNGFRGEQVKLQLMDASGEVVAEYDLDFTTDRSVSIAEMEIPLTNAGLQQFSLNIPPLEGEWSSGNNTFFFSVDVSESRVKVLDIAFELHPDVRMMRSILSTDPNIELTTLTRGRRGYIENSQPENGSFDLIVIHGSATTGIDPLLLSSIRDTPTLYLRKPLSYRMSGQPFILAESRSTQVFQVGFIPDQNNQDHPVLELSEISYTELPPLFSTLDTRQRVPEGKSLLISTFEDIPGDQAVLTVSERGSIRRAELSAWGWYRIYQSPSEADRTFVKGLLSNLVSWVSNDPNDNKLRIAPRKPVFDPNESVVLDGSLRNESGEPESGAIIEIQITNPDGSGRTYGMDSEGEGSYLLELDNVAPGSYEFMATARKNGREIDTYNGEFVVNRSNTELIFTTRNDELLNALALETGGVYMPYTEAGTMWQNIRNKGLTESKQVTSESYFYPVRSFWWFLLVIALLGAEWLIRKRFALP